MRFSLGKLSICLVCGAIINTLVAWSCVFFNFNEIADSERFHKRFDPFPLRPNADWPARGTVTRQRQTVAVREVTMEAWTITDADRETRKNSPSPLAVFANLYRNGPTSAPSATTNAAWFFQSSDWRLQPHHVTGHFVLSTTRAGWPLPCLLGGKASSSGQPGLSGAANPMPVVAVLSPFIHGTRWSEISSRIAKNRTIPLRPLPLGFAINTALYAILCWPLLMAAVACRGRLRSIRGRCEQCAYDLHGSSLPEPEAICPECGHHQRVLASIKPSPLVGSPPEASTGTTPESGRQPDAPSHQASGPVTACRSPAAQLHSH
jgi:hypothetical protein